MVSVTMSESRLFLTAIYEARMKEYDDMCFVEEPEADYTAEKSTVLKHVTA